MMIDAPEDALLRPNQQGQTPLHVAALMADSRFLKVILSKMKVVNELKKRGETINDELGNASGLSSGVECRDSRGRSPVFYACEKNNPAALELLLKAGFSPDDEDREGLRPLQLAMSNGASECVFPLLSSSKYYRDTTQVGKLLRSMGEVNLYHRGRKMTFTQQINWDVIDQIKNPEKPPAIGVAVTKKDQNPVDPVLDSFVGFLKKDAVGSGLSVISKAVEEGNAEQLDLLLQTGISPDLGDATGISPLQRAAESKKWELCIKLIDAGASSDFSCEDIALRAVEDNSSKLAISLIKSGANPNAREKNGMRSLIQIAAENNNWEVLSHLLDAGARLEADVDCHGASASCQSILVTLAKANQLQLLDNLLETAVLQPGGVRHMLINHWDVDCLLRLEKPDLKPLIQKFVSKEFNRPPLENYTRGENE